MNMNRSHRTRQGFTLIELLVLIAIIAILAAILFPVFGRARENARRSSCQSQMKQTGLAFAQYTQDYDETMPLAEGVLATTGTVAAWDALIEPYMQKGTTQFGQGDNPMMKCPSDGIETLDSAGNPVYQFSGGPRRNKRSYAIPFKVTFAAQEADFAWKEPKDPATGIGLGASGSAANRASGRKISEFPNTAATIQMVESPNALNHIGTTNAYRSTGVSNPAASAANYWQFQMGDSTALTIANASLKGKEGQHFNGFNYLFVDGHVKFLRGSGTVGKDMSTTGNANGYKCAGTLANPCGMWTIADDD